MALSFPLARKAPHANYSTARHSHNGRFRQSSDFWKAHVEEKPLFAFCAGIAGIAEHDSSANTADSANFTMFLGVDYLIFSANLANISLAQFAQVFLSSYALLIYHPFRGSAMMKQLCLRLA